MTIDGAALAFTPRELDIVALLRVARRAGASPKDEILETVWGNSRRRGGGEPRRAPRADPPEARAARGRGLHPDRCIGRVGYCMGRSNARSESLTARLLAVVAPALVAGWGASVRGAHVVGARTSPTWMRRARERGERPPPRCAPSSIEPDPLAEAARRARCSKAMNEALEARCSCATSRRSHVYGTSKRAVPVEVATTPPGECAHGGTKRVTGLASLHGCATIGRGGDHRRDRRDAACRRRAYRGRGGDGGDPPRAASPPPIAARTSLEGRSRRCARLVRWSDGVVDADNAPPAPGAGHARDRPPPRHGASTRWSAGSSTRARGRARRARTSRTSSARRSRRSARSSRRSRARPGERRHVAGAIVARMQGRRRPAHPRQSTPSSVLAAPPVRPASRRTTSW